MNDLKTFVSRKRSEILSDIKKYDISTLMKLKEEDNSNLLMYYLSENDLEMVKVLVKKGFDVNYFNLNNNSCLLYSTPSEFKLKKHGMKAFQCFDYLIRSEVQVLNQAGEDSLIALSEIGNLERLSLLVKKGVNINCYNKEGNIALLSAKKFDLKIILLKLGADINLFNKNGYSALSYSSAYEAINHVSLLIKMGADVNRRDSQGSSAILWTITRNRECMFRFLKSKGGYLLEIDKKAMKRRGLKWL